MKIMKNLLDLSRILPILTLIAGILFSCYDDKEYDFDQYQKNQEEVGDKDPTVKELFGPDDNTRIILQEDGNLSFEWEKAEADDDANTYKISYDVLLDKEDGDFSDPLLTQRADEASLVKRAIISHLVLDKMAKDLGILIGQEITLKWTIRTNSNIGNGTVLAAETRKITIVRMEREGLQDGEKLYITGEGSEEGQEVYYKKIRYYESKGSEAQELETYEIYTKLEANKPFHFYSEIDGETRTFSVDVDNNSLTESTGSTPAGATIATTGVYRLRLNIIKKEFSIAPVTNMRVIHAWTGTNLMAFTYESRGVWVGENASFLPKDNNKDERYKLKMNVKEDGADKVICWGESTSAANENMESHYYDVSQWDTNWKVSSVEIFGKNVTGKVFLTGEVYSHSFSY